MTPKDALEAKYKDQLEDMLADFDEEVFDMLNDEPITADGCPVEPDGECQHGYSSPLLLLDMI